MAAAQSNPGAGVTASADITLQGATSSGSIETSPPEAIASAEDFDPIAPARGKSVYLRSVLAWRDSARDTPYVSGSVATALHIASELQLVGLPGPDLTPDGQPIIDAATLLIAIQVLGRQPKLSRWAGYFQNDVLGQDVAAPGFDVQSASILVERAESPSHAEESVNAILQWDAVEVLAEASRLRLATNTKHTQIGIRHLAVAYFLTQAGQAAFRDRGLLARYDGLRQRMVEILQRETGKRYNDDPNAWPPIIDRVRNAPLRVRLTATQVRPDYSSDVVNLDGPDPLNAAADARALADVILLRAARPPLALGVFGPWGSGKSTLMRRLQAEIRQQLKDETARPSQDGDLGRVRNAVQIEFSAWSFADSENLWAALTAEIFDQLAAGGFDGWRNKPRADLVGNLAARLSSEAAALNTASAKAVEHEKAASRLETTLREAETAKNRAGREAIWEVLGGILKDVEPKDGKDKDAPPAELAERAREAFLNAPGGDGAKGLVGTFGAIRVVGAALAKQTWRSVGVFQRVIAWGLGAVFVILSFLAFFGARPIASNIPAGWVGGLGVLVAALPFLASGTRLVSKYLEERAKRRTLALKAEADAKSALVQVNADLAQARKRAETSRAFVDTFTQEANAPAAPGLMLKYLLRESEDLALIRKQIGLINVVRRCFEQLAAIIREMAASHDPDAIDRIIIYIDDLDRCSAKQVVAILEAVHLLLAFDCFVVVVAVDPKWLAHSLNEQHQQFSEGQPSGRASPEDYLEKIFQLALQVRPLADHDLGSGSTFGPYQRFAASLLEPDRARQEEIAATPATPVANDEPPPTIDLRKGFGIASPNRPEDFDAVRLERVSLGEDETRLLLGLGVLAAKSPRAVKRMINVYRLIRISHADRLGAFLKIGVGGGVTYWSVMLALACEIGVPAAAMRMLSNVARTATDAQWRALMTALGKSDEEADLTLSPLPPSFKGLHEALETARVRSAFYAAWGAVESHIDRHLALQEFRAGLSVVARYSLRSQDG